MTALDLPALLAAAETATSGPWDATWDAQVVAGYGSPFDGEYLADCFKLDPAGDDNAAFIAAANPTVVKALVVRLEAAEAAVERVTALTVTTPCTGRPGRCADSRHWAAEAIRAALQGEQ